MFWKPRRVVEGREDRGAAETDCVREYNLFQWRMEGFESKEDDSSLESAKLGATRRLWALAGSMWSCARESRGARGVQSGVAGGYAGEAEGIVEGVCRRQ